MDFDKEFIRVTTEIIGGYRTNETDRRHYISEYISILKRLNILVWDYANGDISPYYYMIDRGFRDQLHNMDEFDEIMEGYSYHEVALICNRGSGFKSERFDPEAKYFSVTYSGDGVVESVESVSKAEFPPFCEACLQEDDYVEWIVKSVERSSEFLLQSLTECFKHIDKAY